MAGLQSDKSAGRVPGVMDTLLEVSGPARAARVPRGAASSPPDAGRGSRRRSQWLAPPEVADRGSVAAGEGVEAARADGRPGSGGSWSAVVLVALLVLLVAMALAIASTATQG